MIETDADRLALVRDLGEKVYIDNCAYYGVFENEYLEDLDGPGVSSSSPMLTVRSSDVASVVPGSTVIRDSVTYTVREVEPDGTGITLLRLRNYG